MITHYGLFGQSVMSSGAGGITEDSFSDAPRRLSDEQEHQLEENGTRPKTLETT